MRLAPVAHPRTQVFPSQQPWSSRSLFRDFVYIFRFGATFAKKCQQTVRTMRAAGERHDAAWGIVRCHTRPDWLTALGLELAYLSGLHRLLERSARRRRCHPQIRARAAARGGCVSSRCEPTRSRRGFSTAMIRALKRWHVRYRRDGRGVPPRQRSRASARRFVCLTFDGGTRDFVDYAYPLLAAHEVPFTVYLPTRLSRRPRRHVVAGAGAGDRDARSHQPDDRSTGSGISRPPSVADKYRAIHYLDGWMRTLPPHDWPWRSTISASAIPSISRRCRVDAAMTLGRCRDVCGGSAGDDRQQHRELSGARQSRPMRGVARNRHGAGGGAGRAAAMSRGISPIRSAIARRSTRARRDGGARPALPVR